MAESLSNPGPRRMPPRFGSLFWDCDLSMLDIDRHADQVIERVLQDGDLASVRWLLHTYGDGVVKRFVIEQGPRHLDAKILSFWYGYYDLGEAPCTTRSSLIDSERGSRY